jgi:predicted HNH restriction endonuclease
LRLDAASIDWDELDALEARYLHASPEVKSRVSKSIERGKVGEFVKKAIGFKCQVCEALGEKSLGFVKPCGEPYVEAHHVMPVFKKQVGSLSASNVMIVCANHHRPMHHGGIHVSITDELFDFAVEDSAIQIPRFRKPGGPSA